MRAVEALEAALFEKEITSEFGGASWKRAITAADGYPHLSCELDVGKS